MRTTGDMCFFQMHFPSKPTPDSCVTAVEVLVMGVSGWEVFPPSLEHMFEVVSTVHRRWLAVVLLFL